ncbi:MAG: hypothetical protein OEY03_08755 [Rhizobacter sp.]|nr:hypothetical protein [Rhizobacter sp.]
MKTIRRAWILVPALVLGLMPGCASYSPGGLSTGATLADVSLSMGKATGEYALPNAGKRLEFARGPFGKHTFMLDFDAQGKLISWDQVLTEARFNSVRAGLSSDELLMTLGRPSERSVVGLLQWQTVWSYRYDAMFCQWFQVGLDAQGRVTDAGYYPDPICEPQHLSDSP